MTAIEVRGLTKTYAGGVEAVKGIDLDIQAGEVFGLLGPNGGRKSHRTSEPSDSPGF
jgi:ABC-2 type transport system ATP-binding protein